MADLVDYNTDEGLWGTEFFSKSIGVVDSLQWWRGACNTSELQKIAVGVLSLPPSSAETERSFKTQSWIHDSKRNRLTTARAGKITYIAHNSKLAHGKKKEQKEPASDSEDDSQSSDCEVEE